MNLSPTKLLCMCQGVAFGAMTAFMVMNLFTSSKESPSTSAPKSPPNVSCASACCTWSPKSTSLEALTSLQNHTWQSPILKPADFSPTLTLSSPDSVTSPLPLLHASSSILQPLVLAPLLHFDSVAPLAQSASVLPVSPCAPAKSPQLALSLVPPVLLPLTPPVLLPHDAMAPLASLTDLSLLPSAVQHLVRLPCGGSALLGKGMLSAMQSNSLPFLLSSIPSYERSVHARMADRLDNDKLRRDALDFAGKVPLSVQLREARISNVLVDVSQAGGLCGTSDGIIIGDHCAEFLEIKGASRKKRYGARSERCQDQYSFHIRLDKTNWKHLFLVCRPEEPSTPEGWTCKEELARCGMVLGYVSRERFEAALPRPCGKVRVSVTPWGVNARNWLGKSMTWVRLADVTRAWWHEHVAIP